MTHVESVDIKYSRGQHQLWSYKRNPNKSLLHICITAPDSQSTSVRDINIDHALIPYLWINTELCTHTKILGKSRFWRLQSIWRKNSNLNPRCDSRILFFFVKSKHSVLDFCHLTNFLRRIHRYKMRCQIQGIKSIWTIIIRLTEKLKFKAPLWWIPQKIYLQQKFQLLKQCNNLKYPQLTFRWVSIDH